jgi:hypothetical protein
MSKIDRLERVYPYLENKNSQLNLLNSRVGNLEKPKYYPDTVSGANKMAI